MSNRQNRDEQQEFVNEAYRDFEEQLKGFNVSSIPLGIITVVAIAAIVICGIIYGLKFPYITNDHKVWAEFGSIAGGVIGPVLAFFSLIAVLYTMRLQLMAFKLSLLSHKATLEELAINRYEITLTRKGVQQTADASQLQAKEAKRQNRLVEEQETNAAEEHKLKLAIQAFERIAFDKRYCSQIVRDIRGSFNPLQKLTRVVKSNPDQDGKIDELIGLLTADWKISSDKNLEQLTNQILGICGESVIIIIVAKASTNKNFGVLSAIEKLKLAQQILFDKNLYTMSSDLQNNGKPTFTIHGELLASLELEALGTQQEKVVMDILAKLETNGEIAQHYEKTKKRYRKSNVLQHCIEKCGSS